MTRRRKQQKRTADLRNSRVGTAYRRFWQCKHGGIEECLIANCYKIEQTFVFEGLQFITSRLPGLHKHTSSMQSIT